MPVRTCVGCRGRFEKASLLRWVVREGRPVPDPRGRLPGRGGYVCRRDECWEAILRRKRSEGFQAEEQAFRLAIRGGVVQNVPGESHEK